MKIRKKFKGLIGSLVSLFKEEKTALDLLKSAETRKKENSQKFKKKMILLLILVPSAFFIFQVIVKSMIIYYQQEDETLIKDKKSELKNFDLKVDSFTTWQDAKDREDEKLNGQLMKLTTNVESIASQLKEGKKENKENLKNMKDEVLEAIENVSKKNDERYTDISNITNSNLKKLESDLDVKINGINTKVATKLSDLQVSEKKIVKLDLPELSTLKNNISSKTTINNTSNKKSDFIPLPSKSNNAPAEEEDKYETVEEDYDEEKFQVSTLVEIKKNDDLEEKEEVLPSFSMMPGFAKAIIVGGADVPTMSAAIKNPKRIWMSISSQQLIANGGMANLKDCLVSGVTQARIANGRASIVLENLSCVMTDRDGTMYKINQKVKGLVYGEDGKSDVKGRLVSKEGEVIKKGLPLAAIEGAMSMLSKTNNYILPNGGTAGEANPIADFATGGAGTGNKLLQKFSEYYLKILEELNPYVEIRAKRLVTIAFDGGQEIKITKYKPFDVNYFYNKEDEYDEEY